MKTALYGRLVFGASAVLLGVIALMWYDAATWQTLSQLWKLPFGVLIGGCLMVLQIAGGMGIQYPPTARYASTLLGFVYTLFSLACLPGIIAAPAVYEPYGSFFEQFSALWRACPVHCHGGECSKGGLARAIGALGAGSLRDFLHAGSDILFSLYG